MRGFQAYFSTLAFLKKVDVVKPDIIHLHNLHNNYIHVGLLFEYIKKHNIKVIWTLHDCWAFTGRCPYFQVSGCEKWKNGCHDCPYPPNEYPSVKVDKSDVLWKKKKAAFTGVKDMTIVTPSEWLASLVKESFLTEYPVKVINNGIDLDAFKPTPSSFRSEKEINDDIKILLGVSFEWNYYKGIDVLLELANRIDDSKYRLVVVGVENPDYYSFPKSVIVVPRTQNKTELAEIYTVADYFINPTREDTYPTVNCEAVACGTPVITFNTGGSLEAIKGYGIATQSKSADAILDALYKIDNKKLLLPEVKELYDRVLRFEDYVRIYDQNE